MTKNNGFLLPKLLLCLVVCFSLSGCPLIAGTMDSVGKLGITAQDRQRLLPERIKKFYEACYWGNSTAVARFVEVSEREKLKDLLKVSPEKIRFVESRIEDVTYSDDSRIATATSRVKYFEVPYYVVHERIDTQEWRFSLSDGWLVHEMSVKVDK